MFREHAALTAFENRAPATSISAVSRRCRTRSTTRSRRCSGRCGKASPAASIASSADGGFFTPDRKARFVAPSRRACTKRHRRPIRSPQHRARARPVAHDDPFRAEPPAGGTQAEPFVEVHRATPPPWRFATAASPGFRPPMAAASSESQVSDNQQPGSLFVPIHWSAETASSACVGELVRARPIRTPGSPRPRQLRRRSQRRVSRSTALPDRASADAAGRHLVVTRRRRHRVEYRLATSQGPMIWHDFAHRSLAAESRLAERLERRRLPGGCASRQRCRGLSLGRPGRGAAEVGPRRPGGAHRARYGAATGKTGFALPYEGDRADRLRLFSGRAAPCAGPLTAGRQTASRISVARCAQARIAVPACRS